MDKSRRSAGSGTRKGSEQGTPGVSAKGLAREPETRLRRGTGEEARKGIGHGTSKRTEEETRKGIGHEPHAALRQLAAAGWNKKALAAKE